MAFCPVGKFAFFLLRPIASVLDPKNDPIFLPPAIPGQFCHKNFQVGRFKSILDPKSGHFLEATMEQAVQQEFSQLAEKDAVLDARYIAWRNEPRPELRAECMQSFHVRLHELRRKAMDHVAELL
jgi:hypothetical protein